MSRGINSGRYVKQNEGMQSLSLVLRDERKVVRLSWSGICDRQNEQKDTSNWMRGYSSDDPQQLFPEFANETESGYGAEVIQIIKIYIYSNIF